MSMLDLKPRLKSRLSGRLPGLDAQLTMAPSQRAGMVTADGPTKARQAAVLVLLENLPNPSIILTERRHDLASHPGQISFPGGQREVEESLLSTALREAREEIDLNPADVEVVGALTPLFVPPSNYMVHPFVAVSNNTLLLSPSDGEVSSIIRAHLSSLLDPANRRTETWNRKGRQVQIPLFDVEGHKVWGATAMILAELIDLVSAD